MKPHSVLLLALLAAPLPILAATSEAPAESRHPFTIGLDAGTLGPGISGSWRFADHFGLRLGVHAFSYSYDGDIEDVNYDIDLDLSSQSVGLDWHPWKKSSFRLTAGVLFNQMELKGTGRPGPGATFELNDTTYTAAEVGTLHAGIEPEPVNFYLGIGGNIYLGKKRHWSIGADLGLVYVGEYNVRLSRSGGLPSPSLDADLEAERQEIQDRVDDFPIYPVLQVSLNFSF